MQAAWSKAIAVSTGAGDEARSRSRRSAESGVEDLVAIFDNGSALGREAASAASRPGQARASPSRTLIEPDWGNVHYIIVSMQGSHAIAAAAAAAATSTFTAALMRLRRFVDIAIRQRKKGKGSATSSFADQLTREPATRELMDRSLIVSTLKAYEAASALLRDGGDHFKLEFAKEGGLRHVVDIVRTCDSIREIEDANKIGFISGVHRLFSRASTEYLREWAAIPMAPEAYKSAFKNASSSVLVSRPETGGPSVAYVGCEACSAILMFSSTAGAEVVQCSACGHMNPLAKAPLASDGRGEEPVGRKQVANNAPRIPRGGNEASPTRRSKSLGEIDAQKTLSVAQTHLDILCPILDDVEVMLRSSPRGSQAAIKLEDGVVGDLIERCTEDIVRVKEFAQSKAKCSEMAVDYGEAQVREKCRVALVCIVNQLFPPDLSMLTVGHPNVPR